MYKFWTVKHKGLNKGQFVLFLGCLCTEYKKKNQIIFAFCFSKKQCHLEKKNTEMTDLITSKQNLKMKKKTNTMKHIL